MLELRLLGAIDLASPDAHAAELVLTQPKRLAILAYLALATPRGFHRREKLLALFWPDSDETHARGALNQALYHLRHSLGEDLILTRGDEEVGLDWQKWWCDAVELRAAAAAERYDDVLKLYRGDLLEGFHANASPEFEQWLDGERSALHKLVLGAAFELAARAEARRHYADAIQWLRRAAAIDPLDEAAVEQLMELLHKTGDDVAALGEYERLRATLATELETEPSAQLSSLAAKLRAFAPTRNQLAIHGRSLVRRRRLLAAMVAAIALTALAAIVFQARRSPTLFASGALAERDVILIADFNNTTPDSSLGMIVTELLRVDLDQSRSLQLLTPAQIRQTLRRMMRDTMQLVSGDVAREIAIREGAKAVLEGGIGPLGSGYALTARITAAENGVVLKSFRRIARSSDDLIDAVEALSHDARVGIGEKLRAVRNAAPLADAATASLPALRAYVAAQEANQQGRNDEVIAQLEAAVGIDSTFVAAHRWLANTYFASFQGNRHAAEHLTLAYRYSSRLPEFERLLTEGVYHKHVSGDSLKAIAAFTRASEIAIRPLHWVSVYENLGGLYASHGDLARSEAMWQARADLHRKTPRERITPRGWGYVFNQLTQVQLAAGRIDAAERTVQTAESYFGKRWFGAAQVAAARHDYDSAEVVLRQIPDDTYAQQQLFDILFLRGRLREAAALPAADQFGRRAELLRTFLDLWFFQQPNVAAARVDALVARDSLERTTIPTRPPYVQLVAFYANAGRMGSARHWFEKVQSVHYDLRLAHSMATSFHGDAFMRGMLALGNKQPQAAIKYLRAANEKYHLCRTCRLVELSLAYQAAGETDSAIAVLERYAAGPQMGTDGFNAAVAIPFAHLRLGELYEAKHDVANASRHYATFMELWNRADPELQPFVLKARAALARMRDART